MTDLPFVDEHTLVVDAPPEVTWRALTQHATGALLLGPHNLTGD
ncbi:hypothetical protein [Kribbella sp. ALI-6-A]|nr:hypothetical protein [Kribbella sp. ALI-6-A]